VANITGAVSALYDLGARYVLVVNLPDLGVQPLVPPGSPLSTLLSELSAEHNKRLEKALKLLEAHSSGLTIIHGDVTGVVDSLRPTFEVTIPLVDVLVPAPPGSLPYSFCLFIDPSSCPAVGDFAMSAQFLFWDAGHPTTAAHERIADQLFLAVWKALRRQVKASAR
jgi:phospholipase/lecithinase/hemolysin